MRKDNEQGFKKYSVDGKEYIFNRDAFKDIVKNCGKSVYKVAQEFGDEKNYSRETLRAWYYGSNSPANVEDIEKIADFFQIALTSIFIEHVSEHENERQDNSIATNGSDIKKKEERINMKKTGTNEPHVEVDRLFGEAKEISKKVEEIRTFLVMKKLKAYLVSEFLFWFYGVKVNWIILSQILKGKYLPSQNLLIALNSLCCDINEVNTSNIMKASASSLNTPHSEKRLNRKVIRFINMDTLILCSFVKRIGGYSEPLIYILFAFIGLRKADDDFWTLVRTLLAHACGNRIQYISDSEDSVYERPAGAINSVFDAEIANSKALFLSCNIDNLFERLYQYNEVKQIAQNNQIFVNHDSSLLTQPSINKILLDIDHAYYDKNTTCLIMYDDSYSGEDQLREAIENYAFSKGLRIIYCKSVKEA